MKITKNNIQDVFRAKLCTVDTMELKGYELVKELFADSSGFGADDEPALTQNQFIKELTGLLEKHGTLYAKVTNAGQFQAYIGLFTRTGEKKCKRIANNTLKIDDGGDDYRIRLHDTDIITVKGGKMILDSGGFYTWTTKNRISRYILDGFGLFQKDFEWFIKTPDEKTIAFTNGMIIN